MQTLGETLEPWQAGREKPAFAHTELLGIFTGSWRSGWAFRFFGFISETGKTTAEKVTNYKAKRKTKERSLRNNIIKSAEKQRKNWKQIFREEENQQCQNWRRQRRSQPAGTPRLQKPPSGGGASQPYLFQTKPKKNLSRGFLCVGKPQKRTRGKKHNREYPMNLANMRSSGWRHPWSRTQGPEVNPNRCGSIRQRRLRSRKAETI